MRITIRSFCEINEDWELGDLIDGFRSSYSHETGISSDYSRHYESKSVAKEIAPGVWVAGPTGMEAESMESHPQCLGWMMLPA